MVHKKKKKIQLDKDIKFLNKAANNLSLKAEEAHNFNLIIKCNSHRKKSKGQWLWDGGHLWFEYEETSYNDFFSINLVNLLAFTHMSTRFNLWFKMSIIFAHMTLEKQISNTCRTSYMQICKISSIQRYLTVDAVKTLVQATVQWD